MAVHDALIDLFFPYGAPDGPVDAERCVTAAGETALAVVGADDLDEEVVNLQVQVRRMLTERLLAGDPPELLNTAVRMLESGIAPERIWDDLSMAWFDAATAELGNLNLVDAAFRANLELLPLPKGWEITAAYLQLASTPIPLDDLDELVAHRLGVDLDVPLVRKLLEGAQDELLTDRRLLLFGDDLAVDPAAVLDGVVLTTRLGEVRDRLVLDADLSAFAYLPEPLETAEGEPVEEDADHAGRTVWHGPAGWLGDAPSGTLLAVRLDGERVNLEEVPEVAPDPELTGLLRELYDQEVREAGLPVPPTSSSSDCGWRTGSVSPSPACRSATCAVRPGSRSAMDLSPTTRPCGHGDATDVCWTRSSTPSPRRSVRLRSMSSACSVS